MYKRSVELSKSCDYMNVNGAMKAGQFEQADKFNTIYALVDPESGTRIYFCNTGYEEKGSNKTQYYFLKKLPNLALPNLTDLKVIR